MRSIPLAILFFATAIITAVAGPFGSAAAQGTPAQDPTFADVLIAEMEEVFAENQGMITHTNTVLGHALDIQGKEGGIVANHHSDADPEIVTTLEFKILWDSDWLVNFPRRYRDATGEEKAAAIEEIFKTGRGKELAREMFLK